jgi:hypothetical protein
MKKLLVASVGLVFLFCLAVPAVSGQRGSTGDKKFDSTLERIDLRGKADPEAPGKRSRRSSIFLNAVGY